MSFFHKKNVTKCLGHHYAIWTSDSNFLLGQNFFFGPANAGPLFRHCIHFVKSKLLKGQFIPGGNLIFLFITMRL